jgi:hypothetical protein
MADEKATGTNTPAKSNAPHDRVVMLSLHPDGTPAQLNPEIIGDEDATLHAAKVQFREQAVSAVDEAERTVTSGAVEDAPQDPFIADLKAKHDKAADAAEKAAEKAVKGLSS